VLELGGGLDFVQKMVGPERGGELGAEHLQGHLSAVSEIARQVDCGHAPAAELALEDVAVGQSGLETTYDFGQVDSPARSYAPRVASRSRWG
jgi:hypothetical protein